MAKVVLSVTITGECGLVQRASLFFQELKFHSIGCSCVRPPFCMMVQDGQFDPFQFQHTSGESGPLKTVEVKKPWGAEIWYVFTERFALKHLILNEDEEFSLQHHDRKKEAWLIVQGKVQLEVGADLDSLKTITLRVGDFYLITPQTIHRAKAIGSEEAIILEVSSSELDDVVRHKDKHGRV